MSTILKFFASVLLLILCMATLADHKNEGIIGPWMTGPLLAPPGHTIPAGHTNWEPYLFVTNDFGIYGNTWRVDSVPSTVTTNPTLIVTQGLTKRMDVQASIPYDHNSQEGQSDTAFGDIALILGFQAIDSPMNRVLPNLRVTIQETFPSGKYNNLNPLKLGTDATGVGSYQTSLGANFQQVYKFRNGKFLRARLSVVYTIPSDVDVSGFNAFGGGFNTSGTVTPGNSLAFDLGFEYTLTQHWVPAIDFTYTYSNKVTFRGQEGVTTRGGIIPATVGVLDKDLFTLAPAMEYNFSPSLGIIAGGWFTMGGKNTRDFVAGVIALNYYH